MLFAEQNSSSVYPCFCIRQGSNKEPWTIFVDVHIYLLYIQGYPFIYQTIKQNDIYWDRTMDIHSDFKSFQMPRFHYMVFLPLYQCF